MGGFVASPVSRHYLRNLANKIRITLNVGNALYLDIMRLVEIVMPKIFPGFQIEVVGIDELGNAHALTDPLNKRIYIREDVYDGACSGKGRDRFTVAHEVGHYLLHNGLVLGLARVRENESVLTYCDPEWQANAFAGELLMPSHLIRDLTVTEIMEMCKVSYDAASLQKRKAS